MSKGMEFIIEQHLFLCRLLIGRSTLLAENRNPIPGLHCMRFFQLSQTGKYGFSLLFIFFFFKQKTAYEIGLGIPAEPLFRSSSFPHKVHRMEMKTAISCTILRH